MSTRIGIILLLIFMVQILVSLYRYNSRLASTLDAQADALELSSVNQKTDLTALATFFSTSLVDFGPAPKPPAQALEKMLSDSLTAVVGKK